MPLTLRAISWLIPATQHGSGTMKPSEQERGKFSDWFEEPVHAQLRHWLLTAFVKNFSE
jgi:hypothetical protein